MPIAPPYLHIMSAPEEERSAVSHLGGRLSELAKYVSEFRAALSLFDLCQAQIEPLAKAHDAVAVPTLEKLLAKIDIGPTPELLARRHLISQMSPWQEYQRIALRDAAMTIFHFGMVLDSISGNGCPIYFASVKSKEIKLQKNLFKNSRFPNWENMRMAVAHAGELRETQETAQLNTVSGNYTVGNCSISSTGGGLGVDVISGRTLAMSWKRKLVRIELSAESLDALEKTASAVFSSFVVLRTGLRSS